MPDRCKAVLKAGVRRRRPEPYPFLRDAVGQVGDNYIIGAGCEMSPETADIRVAMLRDYSESSGQESLCSDTANRTEPADPSTRQALI